uniref:hypothetical protein n=1 Tax=Photorhabdus sp. RM322S TaxID=3342825 RepID=UPI0036DA18DA
MNIFDYYQSTSQRRELQETLSYAAQQHPSGLGASFLEKGSLGNRDPSVAF